MSSARPSEGAQPSLGDRAPNATDAQATPPASSASAAIPFKPAEDPALPSGPQWGLQAVEGSTSSVNVVLALDISKSMLARDVAPNRLERERLVVRRLLRDLNDARIGMVVFAGRAYILAPLTNDQS